jgi:hypothetical protein
MKKAMRPMRVWNEKRKRSAGAPGKSVKTMGGCVLRCRYLRKRYRRDRGWNHEPDGKCRRQGKLDRLGRNWKERKDANLLEDERERFEPNVEKSVDEGDLEAKWKVSEGKGGEKISLSKEPTYVEVEDKDNRLEDWKQDAVEEQRVSFEPWLGWKVYVGMETYARWKA